MIHLIHRDNNNLKISYIEAYTKKSGQRSKIDIVSRKFFSFQLNITRLNNESLS